MCGIGGHDDPDLFKIIYKTGKRLLYWNIFVPAIVSQSL